MGLCAVAGIEELDLPGGGVGGERAVLPVRVLPEAGRLADRVWGASGHDGHVARPGRDPVAAGAAAQDPGQVRDVGGGIESAARATSSTGR